MLAEATAKEHEIIPKVKQSNPFDTDVYNRRHEPHRSVEEVAGGIVMK